MGATDDLASELKMSLPSGVAALSEDHARDLLDALRTSRQRQSHELDQAIDSALNHIPRPLRGAVRKVIGL